MLLYDLQVHNVAFSFELMQDVGLPQPKARPEGNLFFFLMINAKIQIQRNI